MGVVIAVLALIVILAILGFAVTKFLLIIAAIVLALWIIGFFVRAAEGARWYRW
jgi:type II secretory pathway component PulF